MSIDGKVLLWIGISLIYAGCGSSGPPAITQVLPAATASPGNGSPVAEAAWISAFEGGELLAANGARLEVSPGGLDQRSAVLFESEAPWQTAGSASPLVPYGLSYRVDLGPATQTGIINLHVPLPPLPEIEQPESSVFLAWAAPLDGVPNVVGVQNKDGWLTFPIQGGGRYQIMALPERQPRAVAVGLCSDPGSLRLGAFARQGPAAYRRRSSHREGLPASRAGGKPGSSRGVDR